MSNKLMFEVGLDGAGFERGIQRLATTGMASLRNLAMSAFGIYSIGQAFHKTVESATELVHTARNLDMTITQLQVLRQAAENNGKSFDLMRLAFERFNAVRENILTKGVGWEREMAAMQRLGISPEMLKNQTAATLVMGPVGDTAKKSNAADIANDLKTVFSRNGMELFSTLKTNFDELQGSMERMGVLMDTKSAAAIEQMENEMTMLSKIIAANLAPVIVKFAEALFALVGKIQGAAAFWGGAFRDVTATDIKRLFIPEGSLLGHAMGADQTKAYENDAGSFKKIWDAFFGSGIQKGLAQMIPADEEWKKKMDEIKSKLAEDAYNLDHPKPPDTTKDVPESKVPKVKMDRPQQGDSLVRTGNFLGTAKGQIEVLAAEHVKIAREQLGVSRRIEANTRPKPKQVGESHYPIH